MLAIRPSYAFARWSLGNRDSSRSALAVYRSEDAFSVSVALDRSSKRKHERSVGRAPLVPGSCPEVAEVQLPANM